MAGANRWARLRGLSVHVGRKFGRAKHDAFRNLAGASDAHFVFFITPNGRRLGQLLLAIKFFHRDCAS